MSGENNTKELVIKTIKKIDRFEDLKNRKHLKPLEELYCEIQSLQSIEQIIDTNYDESIKIRGNVDSVKVEISQKEKELNKLKDEYNKIVSYTQNIEVKYDKLFDKIYL